MNRASSLRGFTLIELLVVIAIITVLAGMIIGLIGPLRMRAKIVDTNVRMDGVHQNLALVGQTEGSATFRLQQLTEYQAAAVPADTEPGLGGVVVFAAGTETSGPAVGLPKIGNRPPPIGGLYGDWGSRGRGHLAYPWGKKFPDPTAVGTNRSLMGPERFLLRHMSPFNTRKLLKIANILPTKQSDPAWSQTQYMTNRKASEPWNDAWGRPLVVAATLYQPTHKTGATPAVAGWLDGAWPTPPSATTAVDPNTLPRAFSTYGPTMPTPIAATDRSSRKALIEHLSLYQYNRSVYISVAAVGPVSRVSDDALKSADPLPWGDSLDPNTAIGHLDTLWAQANWVCQQAKERPFDKDWSEWSIDNPMWKGVKVDYLTPSKRNADANRDVAGYNYSGREEHCLLSAPLEIR